MASSLQQLMNAPPEELLEELDRVREKEQLVAHERELLERVLEILIESGGPAAEWLMDPTRGLLAIGPLRSQVLRVIELGPPNRLWQPREVHEKLVSAGNNKVSLDNVRVTMGRMSDAGELHQPEPPMAAFGIPPSETLFDEADVPAEDVPAETADE